MHPQTGLIALLQRQPVSRNGIHPQLLNRSIKTVLAAKDVLIRLRGFVARKLHKPVLSSLLVRQYCIRVQRTMAILRQQQLGSLATSPSRTTYGCPLLISVFKEASVPTNDLIARETQHRAARNRLDRFLDTQIANRCGRATPQEIEIQVEALRSLASQALQ